MKQLSQKEIQVAKYIQKDIPLKKRPFMDMGEKLGLTEHDVISIINNLKIQGIIRKFGAIVRHQRAGFTRNAMVIWAVPESRCESIGKLFATYPEITHCYERRPAFKGKYNIFCMVHFKKEGQKPLLKRLSAAAKTDDYKVLSSKEEFKKSSMEYF